MQQQVSGSSQCHWFHLHDRKNIITRTKQTIITKSDLMCLNALQKGSDQDGLYVSYRAGLNMVR